MELKEITITAEASLSYQKFCCAITATNIQQGELQTLRNYAIEEAKKGIKSLCESVKEEPEAKVETKTTFIPQQNQQNIYAPQPQRQQINNYIPKPASQAQLTILANYGIDGAGMDSKTAGTTIRDLRAQGGQF